MAAEPVWQPNYADLGDEQKIRFGAQCVICDARYATPGESIDQLLVHAAIPDREMQREIQNVKRSIFREFDSAYSGMLIRCYRCQRPACPDCWDDDNQMCGECVAARGLARSPRRGLPSSNPLSDGRLVRVEPGRHSDAQRPSWLDALIATQPLDEPLGTSPKQPSVKPRPLDEPANRPMFDDARRSASSPGASFPATPSFPGASVGDSSFSGISSPGLQSSFGASPPGMPSFGVSSPGVQLFGASSPGAQSFGVSSPGGQPFGMSSPGGQPFGNSSPGVQAFGVSSPGASFPGAMDRAAQTSFPGGAFASEPSYNSAPSAMSPASQIGSFSTSTADQFSPFSPSAAPPRMAGSAWEHAAPGGATMAEPGASAASQGGGGSTMVECPRCGTSNYDFVTRCTSCQLQLIQNCPRCQQLNPGYATQCEFCGETLKRLPGWSQVHIPAAPGHTERMRVRGKQVKISNATRRQPKVSKNEQARQRERSVERGTGETQAAPRKVPGLFEVKGGVLVDYVEAHPIVATLSLWGERILTAIVVIFIAGLVTSIVTAELSPSANETLRSVLHVDIRHVLSQFIAQMQLMLDRLKH